jgi:membrane-bound metal-dependent hydrolase YbcI (DUF457 family)
MFIGHYALGLAAKRAAPQTSLGMLVLAPTLADLLWPVFLLAGWEHVTPAPNPNPLLNFTFDSYPISHSLLTLVLWAALVGALYRWRTGYARGALVVGLLVLSHWVLDYVTHRPDLPLYPGGPKVGLGLWNWVAGTVAIEVAMFVAGVVVYARATRARDRMGSFGFWGLVCLLALSYAGSLFAPPPVMPGLAIGGIVFGWLFVVWAAWADRHRDVALPGKA